VLRADLARLLKITLRESFNAPRALAYALMTDLRTLGFLRDNRLLIAPHDLRTSDSTIANDVEAGFFVFAGRALNTNGRSPFDYEILSPIWGEALYGFGWLRHLRAADDAAARATAQALVQDFMAREKQLPALAHSLPVRARRIISFLNQSPLILHNADHEFYQAFITSLIRTVRRLERNILACPDPTARLQAYIALCYAGLCFERGEPLLIRSTRHLSRELTRQILPDGGHISRNPQKLVDILLDLLPLRQTYSSRGYNLPNALSSAIDRMLPMLRLFRHQDSSLALFNGMSVTSVDQVATILMYDETRSKPRMHAPFSGYERLEAQGTLCIMDVGGAPPLAQSGQAHAGPLSFELASGAHKLVVNCGAPRYISTDDMIAFTRSTAAHSTLVIDQASCVLFLHDLHKKWAVPFKRFINGRWGDVVLQGPSVLSERSDELTVLARHDGYDTTIGIMHERRWSLNPDGTSLKGEDRLNISADHHASTLYLRFHLHPHVTARRVQDGRAIMLSLQNGEIWQLSWGWQLSRDMPEPSAPIAIADASLEESLYLGATDGARRTEQIVLRFTTTEAAIAGSLFVTWHFEKLRDAGERA
jgi:uncharacterized heparinase superfamily protein